MLWRIRPWLRLLLIIVCAAVLMVAVGVAINEVYDHDNGGRVRGGWLAAALIAACLSVGVGVLLARTPPRAALAVTDRRGRPPMIAAGTAAQYGVHPSRFDDPGGVAPYLNRDTDAEIRAALLGPKPLIIVQGPRLAGTTRSLAHHVQKAYANRRMLVFRSDPTITVRDMLEVAGVWARGDRAVLWLDAITAGHVAELDAALLRSLPAGLRICVAGETATFTGTHVPARVTEALTEHATTVTLGPLTNDERQTVHTTDHYSDLRAALKDQDPLLLGRLLVSLDQLAAALSRQDEDSVRRTAIMRVVTDWARLGIPRHLDRKLLRTLYADYWRQMTGSTSTAVSKSGFREALDWATSSNTDRPRLVDIIDTGHHRPHPLLTVLAEEPHTGWSAADPLWTYVTQTLPPHERIPLALRTFDRDDYTHTRRLLTHITLHELKREDLDALVPVLLAVGTWLHGLDDPAGARRWWKRIIATDHPDAAPKAMGSLGALEHGQGEVVQARDWYTRAIATDHPDAAPKAMGNLGGLECGLGVPLDVVLGSLFTHSGSDGDARHWFARAVVTDHPDAAPRAMFDFGTLERSYLDVVQARHWYTRAAGTDHPDVAPRAMYNLGEVERERGDVVQARHWYTRAAATDHPDVAPRAMSFLGEVERERGDVVQARHWYTRAASTDHPDEAPTAMFNLGSLEEGQGDLVQARHWYTRAAATDHPDEAPRAMYNLGVLEEEQGNVVQAGDWYTRAAATDHSDVAPRAMYKLGGLELGQNNVVQAGDWYARAVATDDSNAAPVAMCNLGALEDGRCNVVQARHWYTRAAATDHPNAAPRAAENLGRLEIQQGDLAEARRWLALAAGTTHAVVAGRSALTLANLEFTDHRHEQARVWFEQATTSELPGHRPRGNRRTHPVPPRLRRLAPNSPPLALKDHAPFRRYGCRADATLPLDTRRSPALALPFIHAST